MALLIEFAAFIICSVLVTVVVGLAAAALFCKIADGECTSALPRDVPEGVSPASRRSPHNTRSVK